MKKKKNPAAQKSPPPHNFSNGPSLSFLQEPLWLLVSSIPPDTFREVLESAEHIACQGTLYFVLVKRTRHLKETRFFAYHDFISRSIENLKVSLLGFAIDNYSFLAAFGFK